MHFLKGKTVDIAKKPCKTSAMNRCKNIFQILAILSLFMHIMAQLSPIWASESSGLQIQICSGNTFQTITIDENGNEIPAKPSIRMHDCAFCAAVSFTGTIPQENKNITAVGLVHTSRVFNHDTFAPRLKTTRAHQTRAPPSVS